MKIGILTTHPIQYHAPFFRHLAARGDVQVNVLYCHRAGPGDQAAAGFGVAFDWDISLLTEYEHEFLRNVAPIPSLTRFSGLDTPEISQIVHRLTFDALIVYGWHYKSAWQAIRACWQSAVPVLLLSDSHLRTKRSLFKRAAKWPIYRSFIPRFDGCLAVGSWSRDYFLRYGANPDNVFIVPHSIDSHRLWKQAQELDSIRDEVRARWQLSMRDVVWLFAGKFIEKKRPLDFARAILAASRSAKNVKGLMVGDGPLRPICEAYALEHQIPIRFAGFLNQTEITKAYVAADALVLPSTGGETWGLVVNEAMACGRACVVSDQVGCGPDLIEPDRTGAIFPMGDVECLAQMLAHYANPERLKAMGEIARLKVQGHSVEAAADALIAAVRKTVARPFSRRQLMRRKMYLPTASSQQ